MTRTAGKKRRKKLGKVTDIKGRQCGRHDQKDTWQEPSRLSTIRNATIKNLLKPTTNLCRKGDTERNGKPDDGSSFRVGQ